MSATLISALNAAQAASASQHYPQGALYVVATPIGNLCDISLRALHVLALADTVACEDTRHTQSLLRAYGIDKSGAQLLAAHQHNEEQAATAVLDRLRQGQRVAYVSDAGTPGISDPGSRVVAAVRSADLPVIPLPGASSITTALSAAGVVEETGFVFAGFLPSKAGERARSVETLRTEPRAVVLLEAPHRIEALAQALTALATRSLTVARELTKQFEEMATMPAQSLPDWLNQTPQRLRGEFVLVIHPDAAATPASADDRVLKLLLSELPLKSAVRLTAEITGTPRNQLYDRALLLKADAETSDPRD